MLKLLGSICILMGSGAVQAARIRAFRRELSILRGLIAALEEMKNEIRLNRTPMPRLLQKAGFDRGADVTAFFREAALSLRRGSSLMEAWGQACAALPVTERTRRDLAELGRTLCGDEEESCKGIELAIEKLTVTLKEKSSRQTDWEKRGIALCFSAAALLILLLI